MIKRESSLLRSNAFLSPRSPTSFRAVTYQGQARKSNRHIQANLACTRFFSSTRAAMTGTKIDGNAIAKGIREKLNGQIKKTQETNPRYKPSLVIIQGAHVARSNYSAPTDQKTNSW